MFTIFGMTCINLYTNIILCTYIIYIHNFMYIHYIHIFFVYIHNFMYTHYIHTELYKYIILCTYIIYIHFLYTYIILCTYIIYIHMKGCGQERPLEFLAISKCSKVAEFWHVGFVLPEKHCSEVCFAGSLFVV